MDIDTSALMEVLNETSSYAKVIAFYLDKGGTGRTTHSYNFAGYCADVLNKKVLVIDGDRSKNLSDTFCIDGEVTIADVFKTGQFKAYKTSNPNIDIISGDETFTDEGVDIDNAGTKYMEFITWIDAHKEILDKKYDFIIIDTCNDDSKVTRNLLAATHLVVNVATPDGDSFKAISALPRMVEKELKPKTIPFRAKKSVVDFDIVVLPNRITFNGLNNPKLTKEFILEIEQLDNYIGLVPDKKELRESRVLGKNIFAYYNGLSPREKENLEKFIQHMNDIYAKITIIAANKAKSSQ